MEDKNTAQCFGDDTCTGNFMQDLCVDFSVDFTVSVDNCKITDVRCKDCD